MTQDKKYVVMLVPRPLDAVAGGMTRLAQYTQQALSQTHTQFRLIFQPTRLIDRAVLNHLSTPAAYIQFVGRLAFGQIALVHVNVAPKGSTWRKAVFAHTARAFGKKVVLHLHGSGYDAFYAGLDSRKQSQIKSMFQKADGVIVLGTGWRRFVTVTLGVASEKVRIIDNGVPDPGRRKTPDNLVPRIIFVGLVGQRKGIDTLIEALARLPADLAWTCAICGNGEIEKYQASSRAAGLGPDRVTFTGWQDEAQVHDQLAASDIFVLPSRAENQPIAILEAMAMGLPVISTAVGDIPNQVVEGETGHVVPPDDPAALCAALQAMLASSERRQAFGAAGRVRYESTYSIEANLAETLAFYEKVLCSSATGPQDIVSPHNAQRDK